VTGFSVPGDGWLHRLHPWPKVLLVLLGVLAPFVVPIAALPVLIVLPMVGALIAGLGRRYLRNLAIGTMPAIASIIVINGFFFPGAEDFILSLGPFHLSREGLAFGLPIAARIVAAVAVTLAFVMSTRPDDLMEALIEHGAGPRLAFVVLGAIQTIPRMQDKANRILDAQQARGLRVKGSYRARAGAIVPLLGPLVIGSLIDVRERSLALEARAFGAPNKRTAYRELPMQPVDRGAVWIAVAGLVALTGYVVVQIVGALT
jgi:energy-coupling factor transport system permease protein